MTTLQSFIVTKGCGVWFTTDRGLLFGGLQSDFFEIEISSLLNISLWEVKISDTATCCSSLVRSYFLRASKERCPVRSLMTFSETPDWNSCVVPLALRLWLEIFSFLIPAFLHISRSIVASLFFPRGHASNHTSI